MLVENKKWVVVVCDVRVDHDAASASAVVAVQPPASSASPASTITAIPSATDITNVPSAAQRMTAPSVVITAESQAATAAAPVLVSSGHSQSTASKLS